MRAGIPVFLMISLSEVCMEGC